MLWAAGATTPARAAVPEARDYFLQPPPKGRWLQTDVYTIGAQVALEQRIAILDPDVEMLTLRAHALANIGYGELVLGADYRVLFLTLGGSVGVRDTFRTYSNPNGTLSRDDRKNADANGLTANTSQTTAEGRARITVPMGPLFLLSNHALRWENGPDGTFDWFNANVHDGGVFYRADAALLLRSKRVGAIGPIVRYMDMPRLGFRKHEWAGGLWGATRPGLFRRDDVAQLQAYLRPGDREFGQHFLGVAVQVVLAYRAQFEL